MMLLGSLMMGVGQFLAMLAARLDRTKELTAFTMLLRGFHMLADLAHGRVLGAGAAGSGADLAAKMTATLVMLARTSAVP